jgi:putative heme degradation protein
MAFLLIPSELSELCVEAVRTPEVFRFVRDREVILAFKSTLRSPQFFTKPGHAVQRTFSSESFSTAAISGLACRQLNMANNIT